MSTALISRRYASALFALHQESGFDREGLIKATVAVLDTGAAEALASPLFDKTFKASLIKKAIKVKNDSVITRLIDLLASRNKLSLLPEINTQLDDMIIRAGSEIDVQVTVATHLNKREENLLVKALRKTAGANIVLHVVKDPSILGGLIVQMGDRKIDGSLRGKLNSLRQSIVH
ncbi:MAG: ATP synthase F1 subunit delta [Mariprofundaceae bacterium]|nr:ATP synthase F1 subunit delta [Mariprofundaceae bacterium]